jgi:putative oxidoreductase
MKVTTIVIRILLGVLLLFSSIAYFLNLFPQPELTGEMKIFNDGVNASTYLMPLVKAIELICGLAFIANRFIPLAAILIFPISLNILGVHIFFSSRRIASCNFYSIG